MIAFAMLAAVAIFLATVSLFPEASHLYTSVWAMVLWVATTAAACVVIVRRRLWRRPSVFVVHVALLVILAGATTTHFTGTSERQRIEIGQALHIGNEDVTLDDFAIEYYPGTAAPADFVATLTAPDGANMRVSMNCVGIVDGRRIFLTSYDADGDACTFTINNDELGTTVSYCGYALLLLAMIWCSLPKRAATMRRAAVIAGLIAAGGVTTMAAPAEAAPSVLPRDVAAEFGRLYVYHSDRVAPLSTLARDFSLKIYGTTSYRGFTPEQVMTGWLFYYSSWRHDRGIKIKDADTRRCMNLPGKRASLYDFVGPDGYLFDNADHAEANEKFGLVSSAATGSLWAMFPYRADSTAAVTWLTPVSDTPDDMPLDKWRLTRYSLNYIAELVGEQDWDKVVTAVRKIGEYQRMECPNGLPSASRCRAEALFLALSASIWPVVILLVAGIALLIWPRPKAALLAVIAALWVAFVMSLNWYASQHLPMSNGYETMQWMALLALLVCLVLGRRQTMLLPLGSIVAAMALAVAFMGQRNPQLTNLMPVLRSPLLSLHVLSVMLAYALLTIIALSSALWLCGRRALLPLARRMLKPAVFILATGIFIGAVWANTSWGRYWGWDPKETWALVTLIVYCFPLHAVTLPAFGKDRTFAIWTLCAFATVLMTYIGANFLIPGLHSYA